VCIKYPTCLSSETIAYDIDNLPVCKKCPISCATCKIDGFQMICLTCITNFELDANKIKCIQKAAAVVTCGVPLYININYNINFFYLIKPNEYLGS
jgi:hypothetical protein